MTASDQYPAVDPTAKAITDFRFNGIDGASVVIDEAAKTVAVTVPPGTDLTNLTPTLTRTGSGSYSPQGPQDFTNDIIYTITAADGSTRQYTVQVQVMAIPTIDGTVTISGSTVVGQTLTANSDISNGSGALAYQWLRGGTPIGGALYQTYTLVTVDLDQTIQVQVTRSGTTGFVTSAAVGPITEENAAGPLTGTVSISGTAIVGETLTAVTSALGGSGTISYQWLREGEPIGGALYQTYTLVSADQGQAISVRVSRSGNTGTVTSGPIANVVFPALAGTVTISGTPVVGQTLTTNINISNGSGSVSYQWLRGGALINGASNQSYYTLVIADQGQMISVRVSRPEAAGFVTSTAIGLIAPEGTTNVLTGTVTISGTTIVGETLSAVTSALGGSGTISYQWLREGSPIGGATGQTYVILSADLGQALSVRVSRSGNTGTVTSAPTVEVACPAISGTVSVSGTPIVGQTLTATTSILNGSGTVFYQWLREGAFIEGATFQTYTIDSDDLDQTISVRVRRSGTTGFVTSAPTEPVTFSVLSGTVTISGTATVGQTLTANTAGFNGSGPFTYQWRRGESNISGATGQTYTIAGSDWGYVIRVRVSRGGATGTVTSAPTVEVAYPAISGTVAILGDAIVGQTLTANTGTFNGSGSLSYQWLREDTNIAGATGQTYTLVNTDQGKAIKVRISRNETTGFVTSASTAMVIFPALSGTLTITGEAIVGQTLTANAEGFNGSGAISYQWLRGESPIGGATGQTYLLVTADLGSVILVRVNRLEATGFVTSPGTTTVTFSAIEGTVTISGTAIVGETLTANASISNGIGAYSYQWLRGEAVIDGATNSTYSPGNADQGHIITVRVTRTGTEGFLTSDPTATVVFPTINGSVTISGTAMVGQALMANAVISNSGESISYQWLRGESPIGGATNSTYSLVNDDQGNTIRVRVTCAYTAGNITSDPSAMVVFPALTGTVTISGTAIVGQTLTAGASGLNGIGDGTVSYQWLRGESPISGAINSAYSLVNDDQDSPIKVRVTRAYTTEV
jgi:hypothetical protein